ncbi:hypothetical protein [Acetobacter fabarum]|nr:hypothetical protein [Acetobacter fabarum]
MTTVLAEAFCTLRLNARLGAVAGCGRRRMQPDNGNRMGEGTAA